MTRVVHIGLRWTVETRVDRVSPATGALFFAVPLLPGESVTSDSVRVEDGKAQVTLAPGASAAGWTSSLAPAQTVDRLVKLLERPQNGSSPAPART